MARAKPRRRKAPSRAEGENIFTILRGEHRWVARQLAELKTLLDDEADDEDCIALLGQIEGALLSHARAEEQVVYPAFAKAVGFGGPVAEAYEEHAHVAQIFRELRGLDEIDERWEAKVKVLTDMVKHHVKEEEGTMFRLAERRIKKTQAAELALAFRQAKTMILSKPASRRRARGDGAAHLH